ncbi:MAG: hypothetical protein WAW36_14095 [Methylovulum miyakonense]|uniref:hypothetical protein n=1 Tax=Methylovulum miyakonense TaxID=645578 RepID=UPI003BB5FAE5
MSIYLYMQINTFSSFLHYEDHHEFFERTFFIRFAVGILDRTDPHGTSSAKANKRTSDGYACLAGYVDFMGLCDIGAIYLRRVFIAPIFAFIAGFLAAASPDNPVLKPICPIANV